MQIHGMKTLAIAALLIASQAFGQAKGPSQSDEAVLRDLLAIENEIARANRECDYKYFAFIEAAEFIFIDASGGVSTRAQDLATEKDCRKSDYNPLLDETHLKRYGDVAVLTARSTSTSKNAAGQSVTRRNRFTDVFVWRDGRWQLVLGQSTRIPGP